MSKKKFTDGLEWLFGEEAKDTLSTESPLLEETDSKKASDDAPKQRPTKSKGKSGKNFAADLDIYFREAIQQGREEKITPAGSRATKLAKSNPGKQKKRSGGLDSLISQTLANAELEINYGARKRVTFVLEKEKLEELKKMAKEQKTYMKDILRKLVVEYLESSQPDQK
ncbi:MAG: hypothetical protein AAFU60_13675 [Bacteroidota bacterium]